MIRITLMDGSTHDIARGDAQALLPYAHVLVSPFLKTPIEGIVCHKGRPLPVLGPLPTSADLGKDVDQRAWLLVMDDHAQVIRGLPSFTAEAETGSGHDALDAISTVDRMLRSA